MILGIKDNVRDNLYPRRRDYSFIPPSVRLSLSRISRETLEQIFCRVWWTGQPQAREQMIRFLVESDPGLLQLDDYHF